MIITIIYVEDKQEWLPTFLTELWHRRLPKLIQLNLLPDTMAAIAMYNQEGGNISDEAQFGYDPLNGDANKTSVRNQAFNGRYLSFEHISHQLLIVLPSKKL